MKIAIIGAGNVGGTPGAAWANSGHQVVFGAASVKDAAAAAEVAALTWPAAQDALRSAGDLSGKILLDCTNPLKPDLSGLTVGYTVSGAEQVAACAPGARVVTIFNTTGFPNMANPEYREGRSMRL